MKILPFNADTLKEAVAVLKKGGIIAHPADTCYGLAGDLMNPQSFRRIQEIKGRDAQKPMSIMISVAQQLQINRYAVLNDFSSYIAQTLFPGAVTLILPKGPDIPSYYFPENTDIGIRVPMHNVTQDMLMAFRGPLITTSANPSGEPLCLTHQEVVTAFANRPAQPDIVIQGHTNHREASTVIKVMEDYVKIIRKGPVTPSQLEGILGVTVKE